jgi:SAM-dependent methyltransferase
MSPAPVSPAADAHRWHRAADYESLAQEVQFRNAALVARLHPDPGSVRAAYEIGCGTGALTRCLTETLPQAVIDAVDVSAQMLTVARQKDWPARIRFHRAAFPDVALGGNYDAVFSNAALHWTSPRYDEVFRVICGMLRPGGLLCAASAARTAGTDRFTAYLRGRLPGMTAESGGDDFDRRRLTVRQVAELAARSGLRVHDAFVVERTLTVSVSHYARWWVASGGPWRADQRSPTESIETIIDGLGGHEGSIDVVHASVFMVLRRPGAAEAAAGAWDGVTGDA